MSREKCRKCGATLKQDKTHDQYDPDYCSGLCRLKDGVEPYIKSAEEQAMVVEVVKKRNPASFEEYKKNIGGKYTRRFQPEKLNWSANKMNEEELKQAGFRANREPIPGDWDFGEVKDEADALVDEIENNLNEWQVIKNKAKSLGITVFKKKKDQLLAEIKEAEDAI